VEHDDRLFGINPVLELLRSGGRVADTIYVDKDKGGKLIGEIIKNARNAGVTLKMVPKEAVDKMSDGIRHQGVVAMVTPKEYDDPDEMIKAAFAKSDKPLLLLLDGVEDPRNLGSIIRSAEASGTDGVVIPEHRSARLNATVANTSAGALEHMRVAKVMNLKTYIAKLKESGFWILGVEGGSQKNYTDFGMDVPMAIVLGGEGTGLRDVVKTSCDAVVSIPMLGKVGSLNVSVAAGIALYEVVRQRGVKV
jgi:23S rRNA (guanosine2251-2'-O)-methyltransferase